MTRPTTASVEEKVEEPTEPEDANPEESMETVNGTNGGEAAEPNKVEEPQKDEELSDEDGLFSSEFDNLMDPSAFQEGFTDSMDWMNNL